MFAVALGAYFLLDIVLAGILLTVATAVAGQPYYINPYPAVSPSSACQRPPKENLPPLRPIPLS